MRPEEQNPNEAIDKASEEIHSESVSPEVVEQAAKRVWNRISAELTSESVETISGCADFQSLLPAYRAGQLSDARQMLVKDHLHECIACRKEFMRQTASPASAPKRARPRFSVPRWAVAAVLLLAAGLSSWELFQRFGPPPAGPAAIVQSIDGDLYQLAGDEMVLLQPGTELMAGDAIRAAKNTHAMLRLRDGSLVELRERSGLAIGETRRDVTVRLDRGAVIIEAAKRASGHLYVSTRDCRVAVTGTVFSVNSGVKGSRVSVVEGEVHVAQGSRKRILHPGQQYSTSASMTPVAVAEEISWSQNAEKHIALLKEFAALGEEMARQVSLPETRRSSRILDILPAETAIFVALPNLGNTVASAWQVFERRLDQSAVLRDWWEKQMGSQSGPKLNEVVDELQRFGAYLGDEVVITGALGADSKPGAPVFVSELRQSNFVEFAQAELARMGVTTVRSFESAAAIVPGDGKEVLIYTQGDIVAMSPDALALQRVAAAIEGAAPRFAGTDFHQRILASYTGGASLVMSADVGRLAAGEKDTQILGNLQYLVGSQRQNNGITDSRALVTFAGARNGIAGWLANPAPIGALDYVGPEATMVSAFAIKEPSAVIGDLFERIPGIQQEIEEAQVKLGFGIREDLAAAFGDEFVIAVEGPMFPVPSWKLIAEVHSPEKLEWVMKKMFEVLDQAAREHGQAGLTFEESETDGRRYFRVVMPEGKPFAEVHYVVSDGYLIMAPSRVAIDKAIQVRSTGATLASSDSFRSLLPTDAYNNFSGMWYHNLEAALAPLAGLLTEEQQQAIDSLDTVMKPTLILAYGAEDHITVASTSDAFGFTPSNLFGLRMPLSLGSLFGKGKPEAEGEADTTQ